jgi:hypothetical protein
MGVNTFICVPVDRLPHEEEKKKQANWKSVE